MLAVLAVLTVLGSLTFITSQADTEGELRFQFNISDICQKCLTKAETEGKMQHIQYCKDIPDIRVVGGGRDVWEA